MAAADRHRDIMRRLRSSESEALAAAADVIEGHRQNAAELTATVEREKTARERAERQVRDQAREIERLKREHVEARTRPV